MRSQDLRLPTADGQDIFIRHWAPEGATPLRATVQIAHGMAEHSARYAPLAEALTRAGYAVWASDHRGHGRAASSPEALGFFAERGGWDRVLDDLGVVNRHIGQSHPEVPRVLLGHSMGSFAALGFVSRHPQAVSALVLSGSTVGGGALVNAGRLVARLERRRQGPRGRSALLETMSFGAYNKPFEPARTRFDWLTRDAGIVDAYTQDPLCGFRCTNQLWVDLLDALAALGRKRTFESLPRELPVFVIAGGRDPVSNGTKGLVKLVARLQDAGLTRVSQRFYPEGRHEIFNETNRTEVVEDLIGWLDASLASTRAASGERAVR